MLQEVWIVAKEDVPPARKAKILLEKAIRKRKGRVTRTPTTKTTLCLCISGDGSLLSAIRRLGIHRPRVPVLGIHGSPGLGFLHGLSLPTRPAQLAKWADQVIAHIEHEEFLIQERWGLEAQIKDARSELSWALNDVVISKGDLSRMISMKVKVDGDELLSRLRGDGLILASATGSTGYSMAAGGPVVRPELGVIVMTPICPHQAGLRPVVLGENSEVSIEILGGPSSSPAFATLDGQAGLDLSPGQKLVVRRSTNPVRWIMPKGKLHSLSFFERLRQKRGFGV